VIFFVQLVGNQRVNIGNVVVQGGVKRPYVGVYVQTSRVPGGETGEGGAKFGPNDNVLDNTTKLMYGR
jgi:hypothetical protein